MIMEICWICKKLKGQPPERCNGHYQPLDSLSARCEICDKLLEEKQLRVRMWDEDLLICEDCEAELKLKLLSR